MYCIAGNIINHVPQNGDNEAWYQKNLVYTFAATDYHAVVTSKGNNEYPFKKLFSMLSLNYSRLCRESG